jgi:hypothetical protein
MSALLSSIASGGGAGFKISALVKGTIPAGATGTLLSLPEVENTFYRLVFLSINAASTQAGITLTSDGAALESVGVLVGTSVSTQPAGLFNVRRNFSGIESFIGTYDIIECKSFSIDKNAGNTAQDIYYAYEVGSYI